MSNKRMVIAQMLVELALEAAQRERVSLRISLESFVISEDRTNEDVSYGQFDIASDVAKGMALLEKWGRE